MRVQHPSNVGEEPRLQEGRAGYLQAILRNRRIDPVAMRAHRPRLLNVYPAELDTTRARALVTFLRVHDNPRHWANGEHKPCWCRECWWARWELDAAGMLPVDLVVEWRQVIVEWS